MPNSVFIISDSFYNVKTHPADLATESVLLKKAVLKNFPIFTGKQTFWPVAFLKRNSDIGVSCGYCKIFKTTYLEKHLRTAAS